MNPERWRQIEEIYYNILDAPPESRGVLLDSACQGDAGLRSEIESLLRFDSDSGDFLSSGRLRGHIARIGSTVNVPAVGSQIGPYRILSAIGAGAMGEVYLAHDSRLDRQVALKVLPHHCTGDSSRIARFVREAKAASALNHPNIITIYEIGEAGETWYIAAEFIEGITLRERLATGKPELEQLLDIATQCAVALDTAHRAGIVHRDIKPENIMIRPDGLVKVVDFGLARVSEGRRETDAGHTQSGLVMGTPRYMSPEQARGEPVDERTDIFSLGAVIYEMAAGTPAFPGKTTVDVFAALLAPVAPVAECPDMLERVIFRALEKNREARLQSMKELADLLKNCGEMARSGVPMPVRQAASNRDVARWRRSAAGVAIALLAGALIAVPLLSRYSTLSNRGASTEATLNLVPVASFAGPKRFPSFSPDGNQIAFSWDGDLEGKGNGSSLRIYVKPVGNGEPRQLTFATSGKDLAAAWSPDGRWIAFCRELPGATDYQIYIVPAEGGSERKVAQGALGVSWSADGKTLALAHAIKAVPGQQPGGIYLQSLESGERRILTGSNHDYMPRFSPDGKWIAFTRLFSETTSEMFVVSVNGGTPRQLTFDKVGTAGSAWTPDSREIVFGSSRNGAGSAFWRVPIDGGSPTRVPVGPRVLSYPTIPLQGGRMAFNDSFRNTNIYLRVGPGFQQGAVPGKFGEPVGVALSSRSDLSPAISPDGEHIAFVSGRTGKPEIWISRRDGAHAVQLTSLRTASGTPRWSPDGRRIAFDSEVSGKPQIYVIDSHGGSPRQVTAEAFGGFEPSWSPDSKWIYFTSRSSGEPQIWKIPVAGGKAVQVTHSGAFEAAPTADGKLIYFTKPVPDANFAIWAMPAGGGPETAVPELQKFDKITRSWGVLKEGIYFLPKDDPQNQVVRFFSFRTRRVTPLFAIPKETGWDTPMVAISEDGRYALFSQVDHKSQELVMVENFR
jgi:Tol biopolymer transport system component/serine/threonine protein kinase